MVFSDLLFLVTRTELSLKWRLRDLDFKIVCWLFSCQSFISSFRRAEIKPQILTLSNTLSLKHRMRWGLLSKGNISCVFLETFSDKSSISKWNYRKICKLFLHNSLAPGAPDNQKGLQEEAWMDWSLRTVLPSLLLALQKGLRTLPLSIFHLCPLPVNPAYGMSWA